MTLPEAPAHPPPLNKKRTFPNMKISLSWSKKIFVGYTTNPTFFGGRHLFFWLFLEKKSIGTWEAFSYLDPIKLFV